MIGDLRFAFRQFRKSPAFTITALLTLALGIGVNASVFSVVHAVVLRPLPFPQPGELMLVWMHNTREGIDKDVTSFPSFTDWRAQSRRFERLAAYTSIDATVTGRGEPAQIPAVAVSADFFDLFGVAPLRGRTFEAREVEAGQHPVVVISYGFWQQRFGGQPAVGRTLTINGTSREVVGVMPASFSYPAGTHLWTPLALTGNLARLMESRGSLWLSVVGRLRDGETQASAQQEMDTIAGRLAKTYPQNAGQGILLEPLNQAIVGDTRAALLVLSGAVAFVLLIACANLANLFLARAAARERELAVRQALGAGRGRLVRQLLVESILLSVCGGLAGLLLAWWTLDALLSVAPATLPRLDEVRLDLTVLVFTGALSVITAFLFGLAPAMHIRRSDAVGQLKEGSRGSSESPRALRVRATLVAVEIAIAVVLVAAAGLMVRSMWALTHVELGIDTTMLVTGRTDLPPVTYRGVPPVLHFYDVLFERLNGDPRVASAAGVSTLFLSRLPTSATLSAEGQPPPQAGAVVQPVPFDSITPEFFRTAGMRVVEGRTFSRNDVQTAPPVAIVNRALVRRYFPGQPAIGRRITYDNPTRPNATWMTIVGVVSDARRSGPDQDARAEVYVPVAQRPERGLTILVRARTDVAAGAAALREAVRAADPNLPLTIRPADEILAEQLATRRFLLALLGVFAGLAILLALVGTYGVVSYSTLRRTREFGVRLALGAEPAQIMRMVLRQALAMAGIGAAIGLFVAVLSTRALQGFLFGVHAADALTLAVSAATLVAASLLASAIPARRATRVSPTVALRSE